MKPEGGGHVIYPLFHVTERAPDVVNILQVHWYNVQYLGKGAGPDTTNAYAPMWWKACYRLSGLALAVIVV